MREKAGRREMATDKRWVLSVSRKDKETRQEQKSLKDLESLRQIRRINGAAISEARRECSRWRRAGGKGTTSSKGRAVRACTAQKVVQMCESVVRGKAPTCTQKQYRGPWPA